MIKRWIGDKMKNDPATLYYLAMIIVLVVVGLINVIVTAVLYG